MKTQLYSFLLCILLVSCGHFGNKQYIIKGTLPSEKYDGEWIYLVPMDHPSAETVDSVRIVNASFAFLGMGEQVKILRMRPTLRLHIQELLIVTEPGRIIVKADSIGWVGGTHQNEALQRWKEEREKMIQAQHFIFEGLKQTNGRDSLRLIRQRDTLRVQERDFNYRFLLDQGNNTLGRFIHKMVFSSLTDEQQKRLNGLDK